MVNILPSATLFSVLAMIVKAGDEKIPAGVIQIDNFSNEIPIITGFLPSMRSGSPNGVIEAVIDDEGGAHTLSFRYTVDDKGQYSLISTGVVDTTSLTGETKWTDTQGLSPGSGVFTVYDPPSRDHSQRGEISCQLHGKLEKESEGVSFTFHSTAGDYQNGVSSEYDFVRDSCEGVAKNGITVTCSPAAACKGAGIK